jgi:hypothetical protein
MSAVSFAGSNTIAIAMQGMMRASGDMRAAAVNVAQATTRTLNASTEAETVGAEDARGASLESGVLDGKFASYAFLGSTAVVRTSQEQWRSMLDIVLPVRSRAEERGGA